MEVKTNLVGLEYAQLISYVHNIYDTSSVLIIHNDKTDNIAALGSIFDIVQQLSIEGIPSLTAKITQLLAVKNYYGQSGRRELFVIFIRQYETMKEFERIMNESFTIIGPVWLIIFRPLNNKQLLIDYCQSPRGNPFNVAFNTEMLIKCYDDPIIKEWYSIYKNETVMFNLAFWQPNEAFQLFTEKSLYQRRNNIGGITLRVITIEGSPMVENQFGKLGGFFGKIMEELSQSMNFKIEIIRNETLYGNWDERKKEWSGVIKHLYEKNVDFAVSDMVMSTRRLKAVDFTIPLITSRAILCFKEPNITSIQQLEYFKTFHNHVWSIIMLTTIVTTLILTTVKAKMRRIKSLRILFCENYLNVWRIFCQQGLLEVPKIMPLRLTYFSIFITALIISSVYSATLISYLTVPSTVLPFTTLEGFVKDGSYKLVVLKESVHYAMFQETKDQLLKNMGKLIKSEHELPETETEALAQVCSSKTALYSTEETIILQKLPPNCKLITIQTGDINCLAMPISKKSQYTGIMNFHLGRFLDNGMLQHFKYKKKQINSINLQQKYNVVTFSSIETILKIVFIGIVSSAFIFIIELTHFHVTKNKLC
ncbi:glutamate receptor ionotropic, kainate 2-like isoform X3 [Leptopilina heterotoma]|nr:glutamate receptor ionotropic, kainate 2-like isoform X3 [Leptopilina heterotoma]